MSRRRSPARWLGPLALLVAAAAILVTVQASTKDEEKADKPKAEQSRERKSTGSSNGERERTRTTPASTTRKTYRVKAGDTLGAISEKTGVTIDELVRLNPDIDSSSLSIGQTIRLAQ